MTDVRVSALYTYPIKSCAGISHDSVMLERRGLAHDRRWMVVDDAGVFVTQREVPRLALVRPAFDGGALTVDAPGAPALTVPLEGTPGRRLAVRVWRDTCDALDEGDDAARWFSAFLGRPARLVRMADDAQRPTSAQFTDRPGEVGFADGYPLLVISEASLDDLNERLIARGSEPVPMNRFRPNIVLSGCAAGAEDAWRQFHIGGTAFDVVKPCARCAITTVDQSAGEVPDPREPLATLATYRRGQGGALFGQNVIHRGQGALRVGAAVELTVPS